jgi:hypothetical protein
MTDLKILSLVAIFLSRLSSMSLSFICQYLSSSCNISSKLLLKINGKLWITYNLANFFPSFYLQFIHFVSRISSKIQENFNCKFQR